MFTLPSPVNSLTAKHNEVIIDDSDFANADVNGGYLGEELKKLRVQALAEQYDINTKYFTRRVDMFVIPPFCLLSLISFMNKLSFGLCLVDGIQAGVHLSFSDLAGAYAAFFAPYMFFQFFSNLILKRIRPHFWISITVLCYGGIGIGTGYVRSLGALTACQFLHGLFQSGTETAVYYILAHYYEREQAQRRFSIIYSMSCIGGLFSTLINYGAEVHLDKVNGLEDWRWLLIIEGAVTMFSAALLFFILPDFPEGARFFNDNETLFLIKKLEVYGGKSGYNIKSTWKEVLHSAIDPLILLPALMSFGVSFLVYGITLLQPLAYTSLGYTGAEGSKRVTVSWLVAFLWCIIAGFASDFAKIRFPFYFFSCLLSLVGGAILIARKHPDFHDLMKYADTMLIFIGGQGASPLIICWSSLNLGGHLRKSLGISMDIAFGSLGGLVAFWAFVNLKASYKQGYYISISFLSFSIFTGIIYLLVLFRANRIKRTSAYKEKWDKHSERSKIILGDRSPAFDYMY